MYVSAVENLQRSLYFGEKHIDLRIEFVMKQSEVRRMENRKYGTEYKNISYRSAGKSALYSRPAAFEWI